MEMVKVRVLHSPYLCAKGWRPRFWNRSNTERQRKDALFAGQASRRAPRAGASGASIHNPNEVSSHLRWILARVGRVLRDST